MRPFGAQITSEASIPLDTYASNGFRGGVSGEEEGLASEDEVKGDYRRVGGPTHHRRQHGMLLKRRITNVSHLLSWIIMIIFPILFIALALCTASLKDRPLDSRMGMHVQEAIIVAVSVWPIAFAAIVAQSLRGFAAYKAERGVRLITLEQLISSNTVGSAIKVPLVLRRLDFLTIGLIILWGLSPLASQAMQRMLPIGPLGAQLTVNVSYLNTFTDDTAFAGGATFTSKTDNLYGSVLMGTLPSFFKPTDPWGNPRIPQYTLMNETASDDGFYGFNGRETEDYFSMLGMPIQTPIQNISGTNYTAAFTVQSVALSFSCSPILIQKGFTNSSVMTFSKYAMFGLGVTHRDPMSFSVNLISRLSQTIADGNFENTTCLGNPVVIESQVSCDIQNCSVSAVRPLNNVPFEAEVDYGLDVTRLVYNLAQSDPPVDSGTYTATQLYLSNGPGNNTATTEYYPRSLQSLAPGVLDARFSRVMNTYWQAGFAPGSQTGFLNLNDLNTNVTNTTASVTILDTVYKPSWTWIAILLLCSIVLLIAGLGHTICDAQTLGPDVFDFASLFLRNSKYVQLPEGSEQAVPSSRRERTGLLSSLEVMVQDVEPGGEVGRIALGTTQTCSGGEGEGNGKRLKTGRFYQ